MSTYPSTNPKKRDAAIKVMLTPALRQELDAVAEAMGQTPSTAASFAIGQWVAQQRNNLQMGDKIAAEMVRQFGPLVQEVAGMVKHAVEAKS